MKVSAGLRQQLRQRKDLFLLLRIMASSQQQLVDFFKRLSEENPLLNVTSKRIDSGHAIPFKESQYIDNTLALNMALDDEHDGIQSALLSTLKNCAIKLTLSQQRCIRLLIEYIDDNGYLEQSLSTISRHLEKLGIDVSLAQLEQALLTLQHIAPVNGIAARDLRECLLIQAKALNKKNHSRPLSEPHYLQSTIVIIDQYLHLLAAKKYATMQRLLKLSDDQLLACLERIENFQPKPGLAYSNTEKVEYIYPDFVIHIDEAKQINIKPYTQLDLYIDSDNKLLLQSSKNADDKIYLKLKLQQARQWINSLKTQQQLLSQVILYVVNAQSDYFLNASPTLVPIKLKQISEALNIHISSVSRLLNHKYIVVNGETMQLKKLAATYSGVQQKTAAGVQALSTQAVQYYIREIIKGESSQLPLTDVMIVEKIKQFGVTLSRRAVTKHRSILGIAPSNKRKEESICK